VTRAGRVSREDAKLRRGVREGAPDLREQDIVGSPFAVKAWTVHEAFGGDAALGSESDAPRQKGHEASSRLRAQPRVARPPVGGHPSRVLRAGLERISKANRRTTFAATPREGRRSLPADATRISTAGRTRCSSNYRHGGLREAQLQMLGRIADRCDGVRCDMAMLFQPGVFART